MGFLFASSAMADPVPVNATQTGYAGAQAGDWGGHPGAAIGAPDDACANMGALGKINLASNFGFDLPDDADISDISVEIKSGQEGADQAISVQLADNAAVSPGAGAGTARTFVVPGEANGNCTSTEWKTLSGTLTDWGKAGLTYGTINSSNFGLILTTATKASVKIDSICIAISYQTYKGSAVAESCTTPPPQVGNTITVIKNLASGSALPLSDWDYDGSGDMGGAFTLPAAGGSTDFTELSDGSYTITETTKNGFNVSVQCLMGETVVASGVNSVDVNVSGNQHATCIFTNWIPDTSPTGVTFDVYKNWDNSNVPADTPVQVHIACTSGVNLNQTTTIYQAQHGTFTVKGISDPTTCTITETVPAGYTASYDARVCGSETCSETNGTSCSFQNVYDDAYQGGHECDITNTPAPATVTITKTWVVPEGDQGFDHHYSIELECDNGEEICGDGHCSDEIDIDGPYTPGKPVNFEFTISAPSYPQSTCSIEEKVKDSIITVDMSDCVPADSTQTNFDEGGGEYEVEDIPIGPGDKFACEIVNTVFFEGIPTLNRYGMAMLALLMLGAGLVGFRRFV